jgi:hypothetical protein
MKQAEERIESVLPESLKRDAQKKVWATRAGIATIALFLLSIIFYLSAVLIEAKSDEYVRDDTFGAANAASGEGEGEKFMEEDDGVEIVNGTEPQRKKLVGERYHERGKLPDEFNKIEVGLRLMPS